MKTPTPKQTQFQSMNCLRRLSKQALLLAIVLAAMSGLSAWASSIVKANNSDNLDLTTSWTNGVVPGVADIAQWDTNVTAANSTLLDTNATWGGIQILNPGGPVTISATSTNLNTGATLTLNGNGIDMSGAGQNLTLSNGITLNAPQNWNVASGKTLVLNGARAKNQGAALRFYFPDGTAQAYVITNLITYTNAGTAYAGFTNGTVLYTLARGTVDFATVNDIDYTAYNANGQIVGGATISLPGSTTGTIYSNNVTIANGTTVPTAIDFNYTNGAAGFAAGTSTPYVYGMRFNTPQTNTTYTYNGYPAWGVSASGTRTFTYSSVLVTNERGQFRRLAWRWRDGTLWVWKLSHEQLGRERGGDFPKQPRCAVGVVSRGHLQRAFLGVYTKVGVGTMEVMGNGTYTGGTRLYEGRIRVSGTGSIGTGPLNVYGGTFVGVIGGHIYSSTNTMWPGGTFCVEGNTNNTQFICSNLVFAAGSSIAFSNTLSTNTAPLFVSGVAGLTASNTVSLSVFNGSLTTTGVYPLIQSATATAIAANYTLNYLPPRVGALLSNDTAQANLYLVVTNINQPIKWATNSSTWDINTSTNWVDSLGVATTYQQNLYGDQVLFEDAASGTSPITVTLNTNVIPGSVTVNASKTYTISGNGAINGVSSLTKSGSGTLTLQTTNGFTGGIKLNGGLVSFSTLPNLGNGSISFGGGTLQYNGNTDDISVRTVTFNAGNGTIDLNGNAVTFANAIGNSGAGGFTLTGNNKLLINQTNSYYGNTIINSGSTLSLQTTNTSINNSAALVVNGTLDVKTNTTFTLNSSVNQILAGTGTVQGEIFTASGTTISPATNGTPGMLTINGDLTVNGGTLAMDIVGPSGSSKDLLAVNNTGFGNGNLTLNSGVNAGVLQLNVSGTLNNGTYPLITYSGNLSGGAGNLNLTGFSQPGQLAYLSSSASANGSILLNVIYGNTNSVVWVGGNNGGAWDIGATANWIVNGTPSGFYTNGNTVTFDDTSSATAVSLRSTILPASVTLNVTNNNYTFSDNSGNNSGFLSGPVGLTINGAPTTVTTLLIADNNTGPTVINGGILQVGNGTTTGDIGSGNVTNKGTLLFDQADNRVVLGQISGAGSLIQEGSTTLALAANNSYAGPTIISNTASILQIGTGGATGTMGTNAVTDNGTLIFNRSGTVAVPNNISGSGALAKLGSSTLTFSGNLTYQGNTYISNGVVKLTKSEQIPDGNNVSGSTGWLILDGGNTFGTFDLAGFNETINALSGVAGTVDGLITNSGATGTNGLTILGSATTTYEGTIADSSAGAKVEVVLVGTNTLRFNNSANTWSGGTIVGNGATLAVGQVGVAGIGGITLSNGATISMPTAVSTAASIGNTITTLSDAAATFTSGELANNLGGSFVGDATATNVMGLGQGLSLGAGSTEQFTNFLGTVLIPSGATLRFSSTSLTLNGGDYTTFDLEGTGVLQTRNAGTVHLGSLIGTGSINEPQANSGFGNWVIGYKNVDCVFGGTITASNSIVKVGTAKLTLYAPSNMVTSLDSVGDTVTNYIVTNTITYVGATTISNGVLALVAPNNFNGQPNACGKPATFTLAGSGAVLDLSSMGYSADGTNCVTNSVLYLGMDYQGDAAQTLSGVGTIMGGVIASNGVTVSPGLPTGVLTITNSIELGGVVNMNLNTTNSPNSSEISSPTIAIDSTATLVIANIGPALTNAATFQLFSKGVSYTSFASITWPALGSTNVYWTNNLALNGSIAVVPYQTVPTKPPTITNTFNLASGQLTLSWDAAYQGYYSLEAQTNTTSVGLLQQLGSNYGFERNQQGGYHG